MKIPRCLIGFVLCVYVAYMGIVGVAAKIDEMPEPQRSIMLDELLNGASDSITWGYK